MTRLVKIFRVTESFCYECGGQEYLFPMSGDWEEVTDKEYWELREAVTLASAQAQKEGEPQYLMVEYSEYTKSDMFTSATKWKEYLDANK